MKRLLFLLFLLISTVGYSQNTCPVTGDNKGNTPAAQHHQLVDSYKNRSNIPTHFTQINFDDMANLTVTNNMSWDSAVYIDAYILDIKDGGQESCNCHSTIYKDTHIYIVKTANEKDPSNAIIVEATPRFRNTLGTTQDLKNYIGKHVRIYGYLFRDDEHKANSTIDNGAGNHWRHSVWELHPIIKIQPL